MSTFKLETMTVRPSMVDVVAEVDGRRVERSLIIGPYDVESYYLTWAADQIANLAAELGDPDWKDRK